MNFRHNSMHGAFFDLTLSSPSFVRRLMFLSLSPLSYE
jgi:hypothetical protein